MRHNPIAAFKNTSVYWRFLKDNCPKELDSAVMKNVRGTKDFKRHLHGEVLDWLNITDKACFCLL